MVEKVVFLKLNQDLILEVRDYNKAVKARAAKATKVVKEVTALLEKRLNMKLQL